VSAAEFLRPLIDALESAGVPYMLTGSFAAAYHGSPRATQDVDLVVAPEAAQIPALVKLLHERGYYVDEPAAREALRLESQFNAIDPETGWKVDFIIRKSRDFSQSEFDRRREAQLGGQRLVVVTAEDLILAKLEWARLGESERQVDDVAALLRARRGELDLAYIERWVWALSVGAQWQRALTRAG
jgi:hypothetical protein